VTDETTRPTLVLVGGARAVALNVDMAVQALEQARSRGLRTHVTGQAETLVATPAVVAAADEVTPVGFMRPGQTADWAHLRQAAGDRFDAVFSVQEMAQRAVAETALAVGAPGNPVEAVIRVRTKDLCRTALAAAGFPQPAVRLCTGPGDAESFLRGSAGPWIVKPRDAMGSTGVSRIDGITDLPAALALLPDQGPFLVEEFVEGPEFSVEGVFLGGAPTVLAITAKHKVPPPAFVEIGHVLPAELSETTRREIERQVGLALTTAGLRTGGFHAELWLTEGGIVLGELHTRFGGDWIHRMLAHAIPGIELFGLVFDDMLGRSRTHGSLAPTRAAAVRYLTPPPGRVVAVRGLDAVATHPAVLYAGCRIGPGDQVPPLRNSTDRVGCVVVGADTPAQARELACELAASVQIVVEPAGLLTR
jgi:biotin carboxylase